MVIGWGWVPGVHVSAGRDDREQQRIAGFERQRQEDLERRYNRQVLTLRNLQSVMDPLLMAQVYSTRRSPLGRLLEELLLRVFHYLEDDIFSLYCLRRAPSTFRRLIYEPSIWKLFAPSHVRSRTEFLSSLTA